MTTIARSIPTALMNLRQRQTAEELTSEIQKRSEEVSTGLAADPYRTLGSRATDAISIRAQLSRNDGFLVQNRMLGGRLEQIEQALGKVQETGEKILNSAALSVAEPSASAAVLKSTAWAAIEAIVDAMSVQKGGSFTLSGANTHAVPLVSWTNATGAAGKSPEEVVTSITGGRIGDIADARTKIDQLSAAFDGSSPTQAHRFEEMFYNGTPRGEEGLTFRLSETRTLSQPIQADDPAMRDLLRGLAMLASVDVTEIDNREAYGAWMTEAVDALTRGVEGVSQLRVENGLRRSQVEETVAMLDARATFLGREQLEIEGVDQYDAASRLTLLQTQLEASYAVTARLSRLSFLNFI